MPWRQYFWFVQLALLHQALFFLFKCVKFQLFSYIIFGLYNLQCFTKLFSIGLEIVFWFSQIFGLILMLLKNLPYLFKAFGQSGEMDFFFSYTQFVFVLFYIILSIFKRIGCLEATIFLVCSICIVSPTA